VNERLEILNNARRILKEKNRFLPGEVEDILKLLDILIEAQEYNDKLKDAPGQAQRLADDLIQNHALLLTLKQQADELDALKKLSLNLTSSLDLPTVLDAVVSEAMHLVKNASTAQIFLYTNGVLEFGAALDKSGNHNKVKPLPQKNGLTYKVAREGVTIVIDDLESYYLENAASGDGSFAGISPVGSAIGIPLKIKDDVVGVMLLAKTTTGEFSPSESRLLSLLADQAAVAISNASLHLIVSKQAYSDTVTGLPNRRALDERLEQEIARSYRTGTNFAVVMMDLDGFKTVNDNYGHSVGDQVLRLTFNYLATGLRASDFLARYGGDELTLILSQTDPQAAAIVVGKIIEKIRNFSFKAPNGDDIHLGISGGVSIFPLHAITAADLLRSADEALYRAKKHQRGSFIMARGFTGELRSQSPF
jgi:diguanylate cyclase (GGDEF)-like protein